jgi:predicted TIM-barrel fold metal-dependent hydrolase
MSRRERDADPHLPIKLAPCSTDEYPPPPTSAVVREAVRIARLACDDNARRTGVSRRDFLLSSCAVATTLLALDACSKASDKAAGRAPAGTFKIPKEATTEPAAGDAAINGDEFIFDVQGHLLDRTLDPEAGTEFAIASGFPQSECGEHDPRDCFSIEHFLEEMFVRSDTNALVLSAIPVPSAHDPLSPAVMEETTRLAGVVCHDERVLLHGKVAPTTAPLDEVLAGMEALTHAHKIVGWKTYTHLLGPGWWLDDHDRGAPAVGEAVIRKAIQLGVPRIAVHKGIVTAPYNTPVDIGPAARLHPDMNFLVYHGGWELGYAERAYADGDPDRGVNSLVSSLKRAGVAPNTNVYADLGTTWYRLLRDPTQAAHMLGKLLAAVGPDNLVWGTDSIWYGSPQDQIQAFRAFEINAEMQERFGYPALTMELKRKILGLNGARVYGLDPAKVTGLCRFTRDELVEARKSLSKPDAALGPKTRREFLRLAHRDVPGG